jgi:arginase
MENQFILTPYFLDRPLPQLETLIKPGWQVVDVASHKDDQQARMADLYEPLADKVAEILLRGERPVSIAGDCCTTIGVTAGIQRAGLDPMLIWFDAHGDFNTWETSPSGFLGGMPLAMLVGRGEQTLLEALGVKAIREDRVILSDGRDLDPAEGEALAASQVTHLTDVTQLVSYALPEVPLHIHFDVDVIDSGDAPAMSYPAANGPSAETLKGVFHHLAGTGRIKAVSLSSWNPEIDVGLHTQTLCMQLLRSLVGD